MTRTGPGGPLLPRRAVLTGAVALAAGLAACSPDRATPPPPPDPDVVLRLKVATEVRSLLAAYAAVIATHPATGARLRPFAAETRAHDRALSGPPGALATPSPRTTSTGTSGRTSPPPSPVPTTPVGALAWLAGLERAAAVRRRRQLLRAGPDLARLLASVGASESTHAALIAHPAGTA
ncbi:MAG TPA: hypothetical protein VH857_11130 [Actinomycetes bacterium]|jgi:hypothetical protein|nr:hypothetical protein [Actinomycetes bacterium]